MGTVNEFLARINSIEGVDGCLLIRGDDGHLLGQAIDNHQLLSSLLFISGKCTRDIMDKAGFTYCSLLSFEREGGYAFHMFGVDKYYLGIVQTPDGPRDEIIKKVNHLLTFVKKSGQKNLQNQPSGAGGVGGGL